MPSQRFGIPSICFLQFICDKYHSVLRIYVNSKAHCSYTTAPDTEN